jgi:hypothetical protein
VYAAHEAIAKLSGNVYDAVFLDHDLNDVDGSGSYDNEGNETAGVSSGGRELHTQSGSRLVHLA